MANARRADPTVVSPSGRRPTLLYTLATLALLTAVLYWAHEVVIPVALAVLLAFLLEPVVSALQRFRLGRVPAVIAVVILASALLGGIGWTVLQQVAGLTNELSRYEDNIKQKIAALRGAGQGRCPSESTRPPWIRRRVPGRA